MQIIGLGFVVKYTYARGQVTKSEDMPRPRTTFWPRGQSGLEDLTSLIATGIGRTVRKFFIHWHVLRLLSI